MPPLWITLVMEQRHHATMEEYPSDDRLCVWRGVSCFRLSCAGCFYYEQVSLPPAIDALVPKG